MDDRQLRDEVMTVLLAGHETTAMALSWTWYLLDPPTPDRVTRETERVRRALAGLIRQGLAARRHVFF
jgi:cytochrome P450